MITEKLVGLIPSKDMREKIAQTDFRFTDMEMVKLAYGFAQSYAQRIEYLTELLSFVKDAKAAAIIQELLQDEKRKLDYMMRTEENTFYDVVIYERPKMDASRYSFRTYDEAAAFIREYVRECAKDDDFHEDPNIKYEIDKRYFKTYHMNDFDYAEDILAYGEFGIGGVLRKVALIDKKFGACDGVCYKCRRKCAEIKAERVTIKYPKIFKKYDPITYLNYDKERKYGIVLSSHGAKDSCDYCIELDAEYFCDHGFENYRCAHEHIDASEGERIAVDNLPRRKKELYFALIEHIKNNG